MTAETLLSHLEGVRRTGSDRWIAKCPAHDDRHPSLSVRELNDGRVLINCFGGCGAAQVLDAVGLSYDALFPPKPVDHAGRLPRPVFRDDVFEIVRREAAIVHLIGGDLHKNRSISEDDYRRLGQAIGKLERVAGLAYGS